MSCSGGNVFAFEIVHDRLGRLDADLIGMLDRVGVNLAFLDRLFAFRLAVEGDDLHLIGLAGFFEGGERAESRRIVDRKDAGQVGMSLQRILSRPVALVLFPIARQLGDDVDFARGCVPRCIPRSLL